MSSETEVPSTPEIQNDPPAPTVAVEDKPAKLAAAKKRAKKAERAQTAKAKGERDIEIGPKDYDRVVLPAAEDDPHWDPKMKLPVPEGLVKGMAEFGWDRSSRLRAVETDDGKLAIVNGRTRWRALEKANKLRKANGLEPITAYLTVVDQQDDIEGAVRDMRQGVRLNRHQLEMDPMTLAESVYRALSAGVEEKQAAEDHAISVNDLHGYLLLLDEDKCPASVQELLREGKISFAAALELARRADKMTKGEITQAAEQVAKIAGGGLKVTAAQVKKAAGVNAEGPATQKEKKQLILDLQSGELRGKAGEAVKWAAIVALEVGLGTRTVDSAWAAFGKLAQGQTIRVDFKQYLGAADAPDKPVKGQEK